VVSQKRVSMEAFHDGYKGLHLTLEMKSFTRSLNLRWIPVCSLAIRSLDLPLVTTISIAGRDREREREREREESLANR
jgi:hypothetical protein